MDTAVRWSVSGGCPTGDPNLHHYAGELYYKGELGVAVYLTLTALPCDIRDKPTQLRGIYDTAECSRQTVSLRRRRHTSLRLAREIPPTYSPSSFSSGTLAQFSRISHDMSRQS